MKHLIAPISAAALMAGLAACSGADTTIETADNDTAPYSENTVDDMNDTTVDTDITTETELDRPVYVMAAGEMKAWTISALPPS